MMPNLKVIITEHQIIHSNLIPTSYRKTCSIKVDGELIERIRIKFNFNLIRNILFNAKQANNTKSRKGKTSTVHHNPIRTL